ncbi:HAMP domain-containing sensor histidine kinase [Streptomyces sp. NPDC048057]|uniref:sensor histidine kinase n=1 Tax=Streptomyces sp. NPDC048057 TaxID=3155628 RepID=UPI0033F69BDF
MLLLVGAALAAPIVGITVVWQAQLDEQVDARLEWEATRLRTFAHTRVQPDGEPYTDGATLLREFLRENIPNRDETFFSIVDGRADLRSASEPPVRLDTDPAVIRLLSSVKGNSETAVGWLDSSVGKVRYGVVPVKVGTDTRDVRLVVLEFRDRQLHEEREVAKMLLATGFGALICAGLASWLVAGRILAPVRLVRQTAARIGESDLTQRLDVQGDDDVAALAHTFNNMLDRLERAFTTQRRFLDEVGHELRTPITVVRGHLELMENGAGDWAMEWDVTRALVVDELDRMSRIVDDLLLLAKAERPDFLTVGETNLTDLIVDVVAKARALGDRHWRVAAVSEATVLVDGQRLTQGLIQLAANAVRHTLDGDLIEMGSAVREGRILLWVRDTGPGVGPVDRERIFGRFVQAGRVTSPAQAGTGIGLGLAIVREIAQAHGGTAWVEDAETGGARFVLDLPAYFPWQRGHHATDSDSGGRGRNRLLRRKGPAEQRVRDGSRR